MLEADPRNINLTKMVAWERINIGAALYELGQLRPALASQIAAMDLLRPVLDLDAKNEDCALRHRVRDERGRQNAARAGRAEGGTARSSLNRLDLLSRASGLAGRAISPQDAHLLGSIYERLGLTARGWRRRTPAANTLLRGSGTLVRARRAHRDCRPEAERAVAISRARAA